MTKADDLPPTTTLHDARGWLLDQLLWGAHCPCCNQFAKEYHRKLNAGMASALAWMYAAHGTDWQDKTETLRGKGSAARDESLLRHWGLLEEDRRLVRDDGGRAGWWRVTEPGARFVRGTIRVYSHIVIYNNEFLRFEGEPVRITDCLGSGFDLAELMSDGAA